MSVKVKISYTEPHELRAVLELLGPAVKSCKAGKGENGRYRKAYLEVDMSEKNARKSASPPLIRVKAGHMGDRGGAITRK